MQKGQLNLHYNYELDELFIIKRGVIKGYYMLEDWYGTSLFKTLEELEKSSTLVGNSILVQEL